MFWGRADGSKMRYEMTQTTVNDYTNTHNIKVKYLCEQQGQIATAHKGIDNNQK
jgi:hypothetical protein